MRCRYSACTNARSWRPPVARPWKRSGGVGKGGREAESQLWFEACDGALSELGGFQEKWGIPDSPECGSSPSCCSCCTVDCQCGVRHLRYAWSQGYRFRLRCSPGSTFIGELKKKDWGFGPTDRGFSSIFILLVVPSFLFQSGSAERSLGSIRGLGIFVELALAKTTPNRNVWLVLRDFVADVYTNWLR